MAEQAVFLLIWLLTFPFLGALLLALYPRLLAGVPEREKVSAQRTPLYLSAAVCLACGLAGLAIRPALAARQPLEAVVGWVREPFHFALRADSLNLLLFLPIAAGSALAFSFRAALAASPQREAQRGLLIFGLGAVALFAADLLSFFLCLELMWLVWALLYTDAGREVRTDHKQASLSAPGKRFWLTWGGSGLGLLLGLALVFRLAGETNLHTAGALLIARPPGPLALAAGLIAASLVAKLTLLPLQGHLLTAAETSPVHLPTLVTVVLPVTAYAGLRILPALFPAPIIHAESPWVLLAALAALWYGGLRALLTGDRRQVAAYSTISQIAYFLLALAASGGPTSGPALSGAIVFLLSFCFAQTLFLMCLALADRAPESAAGSRAGGIRLVIPAAIASAALCGFPLFSGFQAHRLLFTAAWRASGSIAALVPAGGLLLTAAYCARLLASLSGQRSRRTLIPGGASVWMPIAAAGAVVLLLGNWPGLWQTWVGEILERVFLLELKR